MRSLLGIAILLFSISFYLPAQAGLAPPPLWQNNFGDELTDLTGQDDAAQAIAFPFPFPFNDNVYNNAAVSTNGCIHLNGLGLTGTTDGQSWNNMEQFLSDSDPDNPSFCPFGTDLALGIIGTIYYNNLSDPLIITWDGVGTDQNLNIPSTFQILLYRDGRIVFNYNGIMVGGDFNTDLDEGIVSGITPSDLPFFPGDPPTIPSDPGPVNLNQGPFGFGPTVYERWCFDVANSCGVDGTNTGLPGPINTAFDLDFWSICFAPSGGGFDITSGFEGEEGFSCMTIPSMVPTLSEWGLIALAGILGIVGFMVIRRRKVTA